MAKVTEVNPDNIKYKKHSNMDGPTYTLPIADVMAINYENGEKEMFDNNTAMPSGTVPNGGIAKPSGKNGSIINSYNTEAKFIVNKAKKRTAYDWAGILGIDTSSIMSSDLLEIAVVQSEGCLLNGDYFHPWPFNGHFYLELKNKSLQTVYVDLGNTFRVDQKGAYKVYYDTKQTTVSHGKESGVGLNVGSVANVVGIGGAVGTLANGVTVGTGSSSGVSTTYSKQRVIAIPPQGTTVLERCEWEHVKGVALYKEENCVYKSYCEGFNYSRLKRGIKDGETINYTFENSPWKYMYTITYSLSEQFVTWEALTLNVYARSITGGINIYKSFETIKEKMDHYTPQTIVIGGKCSL